MIYKILLFIFMILPIASHAIWVSDTDKRYEQRDSATYAAVFKNRQVIDYGPEHSQNAQEIADLQAIIAEHESFAPAYVQLARATLNSGYLSSDNYDPVVLDHSIEYLKKALKIEPKYDYAMVMIGFTLIMQGKYSEAESYYHQAIALHSGYPYIFSQLGSLERHRGDNAKAITYLIQGYQENKTNAKVATGYVNGIISTYQNMFYRGGVEDNNQEIEKWQKIRIDLEPDSAWSWGDYAQFKLYNLGDYESAIKYGEKALSIMNYGVGRYTLASAYYVKWAVLESKKTKKNEARLIWKKAEKLYPLTGEMIPQLVLLGRGHYNNIEKILESKLAKQQSN